MFTDAPAHVERLKKIFPGRKHIIMNSKEAERVKYAHNMFGTLKVIYFNCIYDLCQKRGLNHRKVREGRVLNNMKSYSKQY